MDHACYKCGAMVEDGAPFCPECRAPQIRVNIPTSGNADLDQPATEPFPPGTPGEVQPPAKPVPLVTRVRLRDAFGSSFAASLLVVACMLFWPAALLLIVIVGGGFAVLLYARRRPEAHLSTGGAARVGALSGLMCAVLFVLMFLGQFLSDGGAAVKQSMIDRINHMAASNPEAAKTLLNNINQPDYFAAMVVGGILMISVIMVALSAVGGAVVGRLQRRTER